MIRNIGLDKEYNLRILNTVHIAKNSGKWNTGYVSTGIRNIIIRNKRDGFRSMIGIFMFTLKKKVIWRSTVHGMQWIFFFNSPNMKSSKNSNCPIYFLYPAALWDETGGKIWEHQKGETMQTVIIYNHIPEEILAERQNRSGFDSSLPFPSAETTKKLNIFSF